MSTFGKELKKIRKKRNMKQADFAKELSVSTQSYGRIERDMMKIVTKNMRTIVESDYLTSAETKQLNNVIAKEAKDKINALGDTLGEELKRIRLTKGMPIAEFSDYLGINKNTYIGIESNRLSPRAGSAVAISKNENLTAEQRERLQKYIPEEKLNPKVFKKRIAKESKEESKPMFTDAERLAYRRRKNEKYRREMELPRKVRGREIKQAIPRSMTQRMFH